MNRNAILLVLLSLVLAACGPTETPIPVDLPTAVGMPNPASEFCEANGGTLQIRTAADGSQSGACVFPDGSECEEWAFFRSECAPGESVSAMDGTNEPGFVPVALVVTSPLDGAVVNTPQIQVTGKASPDAVVTVNDEILIAGADGAFEALVTLEEGQNLIEVIASDITGSEAFLNLTVIYEP